jgi:hypothetical protein
MGSCDTAQRGQAGNQSFWVDGSGHARMVVSCGQPSPNLTRRRDADKVRTLRMTTAPKNMNDGQAMYRLHIRVAFLPGEQKGPN